MRQRAGKFNTGENRGTAVCFICQNRFQEANIERGHGGCNGEYGCFTLAGIENEHSDNFGNIKAGFAQSGAADHEAFPNDHCPTCRPELEVLYTREGRSEYKRTGRLPQPKGEVRG